MEICFGWNISWNFLLLIMDKKGICFRFNTYPILQFLCHKKTKAAQKIHKVPTNLESLELVFLGARAPLGSLDVKVKAKKLRNKTWSSVSNSTSVLPFILYNFSLFPFPFSLIPYPLSLIHTPCSLSPGTVPFTKFR